MARAKKTDNHTPEEKGYADMKAGRTKSAKSAFADITERL